MYLGDRSIGDVDVEAKVAACGGWRTLPADQPTGALSKGNNEETGYRQQRPAGAIRRSHSAATAAVHA